MKSDTRIWTFYCIKLKLRSAKRSKHFLRWKYIFNEQHQQINVKRVNFLMWNQRNHNFSKYFVTNFVKTFNIILFECFSAHSVRLQTNLTHSYILKLQCFLKIFLTVQLFINEMPITETNRKIIFPNYFYISDYVIILTKCLRI